MYPLKMKPVIKDIIWGGNKMKEMFGKEYDFEKAGESWEVSTNSAGKSIIANGELSGMTLADAIAKYPEIAGKTLDDFPLMLKIIDANSDLSIQVHPGDDYAAKHENGARGKTEMWYIISAEPDAKIGYGLKKPMSNDEIRAAIEKGNLEEYIRYINVLAGETYFIPAGTIHSICFMLIRLSMLFSKLLPRPNRALMMVLRKKILFTAITSCVMLSIPIKPTMTALLRVIIFCFSRTVREKFLTAAARKSLLPEIHS